MPGSEWTLYVEGKDDRQVIVHLLKRRGSPQPTPDPDIVASGDKKKVLEAIRPLGDKKRVLKAIKTSVRAGAGKSLGFVLDANGDPGGTWQSAMARLREGGVEVPPAIPVDGFVGEFDREGQDARREIRRRRRQESRAPCLTGLAGDAGASIRIGDRGALSPRRHRSGTAVHWRLGPGTGATPRRRGAPRPRGEAPPRLAGSARNR